LGKLILPHSLTVTLRGFCNRSQVPGFKDSGFKFNHIQSFTEFQQTFTASRAGKKGGFYHNFNLKRQIRNTAGLSIRNIDGRERAKTNTERMNPEPVNG